MEALVVKCDIPKLSTYQFPMFVPPNLFTVVPKFIVVWPPVCSQSDLIQEILSKLTSFLANTQ